MGRLEISLAISLISGIQLDAGSDEKTMLMKAKAKSEQK